MQHGSPTGLGFAGAGLTPAHSTNLWGYLN
jgi:hypothetical protein